LYDSVNVFLKISINMDNKKGLLKSNLFLEEERNMFWRKRERQYIDEIKELREKIN